MVIIKLVMFKDNPELCIERAEEWTLAQDVALLKKLEDISEKLISKTESVLHSVEQFESDITNTHLQMKNVSHKFLLLADQQFIEHRVNEDDEAIDIKISEPSESFAKNEASEALLHCISSMESAFNKLNDDFEDNTLDDQLSPSSNIRSTENQDLNQSDDELSVSPKSDEFEKDNISVPPSTYSNVYNDIHDDLVSALVKKKNVFASSSSDTEQSTTSDLQPSNCSQERKDNAEVPITDQVNRMLKQRFNEEQSNKKVKSIGDMKSETEEQLFAKPSSERISNGLQNKKILPKEEGSVSEKVENTSQNIPPPLKIITTVPVKPKAVARKEISLFDSESSDEEPAVVRSKKLLPKEGFVPDKSDSKGFPFGGKYIFPEDFVDDDLFSDNFNAKKELTSTVKNAPVRNTNKENVSGPLLDPESDGLFSPETVDGEVASFPAKVKLLSDNLKFGPNAKRLPPRSTLFSPSKTSGEEDISKSSVPKTVPDEKRNKNETSSATVENGSHHKSSLVSSGIDSAKGNEIESKLLPTFDTTLLPSMAKTRAKVNTGRRPPSRFHRQKSVQIEAPINPPGLSLPKESEKPESSVLVPSPRNASVFSPATDEEDLFLVPAVKFPHETSSSNLFHESLLSPGECVTESLYNNDDFDLFKCEEKTQLPTNASSGKSNHKFSYVENLFDDDDENDDPLNLKSSKSKGSSQDDFESKVNVGSIASKESKLAGKTSNMEEPKLSYKVPLSLFDDSDEDLSLFSGSNLKSSASNASSISKREESSTVKVTNQSSRGPNLFDDLFSDDSDSLFSEPTIKKNKSVKKT